MACGRRDGAPRRLLTGRYRAELSSQRPSGVGFDSRWFVGSSEFTIVRKSNTRVRVVCRLASAMVSVRMDDALRAGLDDAESVKITVTVGGQSYEFGANEARAVYFNFDGESPAAQVRMVGSADGADIDLTEAFRIERGEWIRLRPTLDDDMTKVIVPPSHSEVAQITDGDDWL